MQKHQGADQLCLGAYLLQSRIRNMMIAPHRQGDCGCILRRLAVSSRSLLALPADAL
jgi:hypothetical protein